MNYRSLLIIFIIFNISVNFLIAEVSNINLSYPIKLKLHDSEIYKTHILCFTEKGFVTCDNSDLVEEDITIFANYHSYDDLEYLQVKGNLILESLLIGGVVYLFAKSSVSNDPERADIESFYANYLTGIITGFLVLISLASPKKTNFSTTEEIEKFPTKFVTYSDQLPIKLQEFIELHEK